MIRITCDRCEKVLEIPDDLQGRKVECPSCGDVNQVPGKAPGRSGTADRRTGRSSTHDDAHDRAVAAGLPPDSGPETRVLLVHPALFRARPLQSLLIILLMLAAAFGIVWFLWGSPHRAMTWVSAAVFAAGVLTILFWKVGTLTEALEITNKRTIERRGLFSKATTEVVHDHVRNVQITQSFWERIWRVGRLGLSSSAQDDVEIVMDDLPDPERLKRIIDLYRPLG